MISSEALPRGGELRALLRHWRSTRRKSQLEVALEAGVSQRHFSFIESGRSAPSRETLVAIADALDIPLRERNELLLASGFAPIYSEMTWSAPEMRSITTAADRMLRQQEPYPAVLMDRYWNVLSSNDATMRFFGSFTDMEARNLSFVKDGNVLNYFSMVSTVGTPQTIASQELRLECMFPADESTDKHHLAIMKRAAKPASTNNTPTATATREGVATISTAG